MRFDLGFAVMDLFEHRFDIIGGGGGIEAVVFFGILGDEAFVGRCILFDVDAFGALRGLFDQILHRVSALGGLERFAEHLSEPAAKEVGDHVDQHRDP